MVTTGLPLKVSLHRTNLAGSKTLKGSERPELSADCISVMAGYCGNLSGKDIIIELAQGV